MQENKKTAKQGEGEDLFAEMDSEYLDKHVSTEANDALKDDYARLSALRKQFNQENQATRKKMNKKSNIKSLDKKLAKVKKGSIQVKRGSSDPRQRYMTLFKPKVAPLTCYEIDHQFSGFNDGVIFGRCTKFCVDNKGYLHGLYKSTHSFCESRITDYYVTKYNHGCQIEKYEISRGKIKEDSRESFAPSDCSPHPNKYRIPKSEKIYGLMDKKLDNSTTVRIIKATVLKPTTW
jgi:hypothetical protein